MLQWVMLTHCIRIVAAIVGFGYLFGCSVCSADGSSGGPIIAPGLGVGQVRIGERLEEVHRILGKPAEQDAAMGGKLTEVWRSGSTFAGETAGRKEELEIYFHGPGAGGDQNKPTVVVQIRITSPFFRTASGISVKSSFAQIKKAYPRGDRDRDWERSLPVGLNKSPEEGLVDRHAGIAFEFRAGGSANPDKPGYCVAIQVFHRGTTPLPIGPFGE
jgi:hypothetical protein